ncbi:MAG: hypothetical protein ACT4OF_03455 [Caulobacteraceae bacterium]
MSIFPNAERVLAAVGGLALFALNEVRMFHSLPRMPDPGNGQTHAASIQIMDAATPVYLSLTDLVVRWGLAGLTVALCLWALAETFGQPDQPAERS